MQLIMQSINKKIIVIIQYLEIIRDIEKIFKDGLMAWKKKNSFVF